MKRLLRSLLLGATLFAGPSLIAAQEYRLPADLVLSDEPTVAEPRAAYYETHSRVSHLQEVTTADLSDGGCAGGATGASAGDVTYECCDCVGNWLDNTLLWAGFDAFKSLGDSIPPAGTGTGFMNSAGAVAGFNTGFRLGDLRPRGQIGASYGVYDWKGRDTVSNSSAEQQTFLTVGVYKRSDVAECDNISWGLVYDQFWGHQWGVFANEVYLGQFRGIVGYAWNDWNEVGVWGTLHTTTDSTAPFLTPPAIRAMNQANVYLRHNWEFGGSTMAYAGAVDNADVASWLLGMLGTAPLNDRVSLYGNAVFALPGSGGCADGSNELQWNLGVGLQVSLGGKSVSSTVSGHQGLPLLPVANNGSFLITN